MWLWTKLWSGEFQMSDSFPRCFKIMLLVWAMGMICPVLDVLWCVNQMPKNRVGGSMLHVAIPSGNASVAVARPTTTAHGPAWSLVDIWCDIFHRKWAVNNLEFSTHSMQLAVGMFQWTLGTPIFWLIAKNVLKTCDVHCLFRPEVELFRI